MSGDYTDCGGEVLWNLQARKIIEIQIAHTHFRGLESRLNCPYDSDMRTVERGDQSIPQFPPSDETGDVDVNLIYLNLQLTPAERIEKHYHARLFVQRLQRLARERNGTTSADFEASGRP